MEMKVIAHIHTDFPEKFGIPRQSGLVEALTGEIVFEPEYRNPDALRGLDGFSHLWLLWAFSANAQGDFRPTVRPPRLGGNTRMGVFATRSPFRPNPIGLSCVRLLKISQESNGPVLYVSGADMMDGTPIYDIKPYLPYADSHPDALGGFGQAVKDYHLQVDVPQKLADLVPKDKLEALCQVLANDPRPSYQEDEAREYGMDFAGLAIRFTVQKDTLHVCSIMRKGDNAR